MKLLILPTVLLCCISAFSQIDRGQIPGIQPKFPLYHYERGQNQVIIPYSKTMSTVQNFQSLTRSFGGMVYLPQDHMPCIVPSAVTVAVIPNCWGVPLFRMTGIMPNPAQPLDMNQLPLMNGQNNIEQAIPIK